MEQTATTYISSPSAFHPLLNPVRARKSERFHLKQGFVAFSARNFYEIQNISKSGMCLQYLAYEGSECDDINGTNILNNLEGFILPEIPCRIVYFKDTQPSGQHSQSVIRRVGLQFINLSADQQEKIDDLINRFSTEKDTLH